MGILKFDKIDLRFKKLKHEHKDYCPHCHRRTPHIKYAGIKMCNHCSHQEKY